MRNNKGITLIALVITIIVLLILAGVSIAMLTGENGLLTKSNSAALKTRAAEAKENVETAISAVYTKKLAENPLAGVTSLELADIVAEIKAMNNITDDDTVSAGTNEITYNGIKVKLDTNNMKVTEVQDENSKKIEL